MATKADPVEQLAKWVHDAVRAAEPAESRPYWTGWRRLGEESRERYRRLARRLLADPPACLVRAVLALAKGD